MENSVKKGNIFTDNALVKSMGTQRLVVLIAVIALCVVFSLLSPAFRQYTTLISILEYSYYLGFLAIGVTFCLITGGVDLSIGTGMMAYSLIGAYIVDKFEVPAVLALLLCVVLGVLVGVFNGFLVAVLDLPPFLATLATMMIVRGAGSLATGAKSAAWPSIVEEAGAYKAAFRITLEDGTMIPIGVVYLIIAVIVMSIVLNKTKMGRYIIGVGSNKEALRLSGVNVVKWQWSAYIISGLFAGLAAVMYGGIMVTSIAPSSGAGYELYAIGAAIIGGTSPTGGEGSIFGTMLGLFVMVLLQIGLPFVGIQANYQQVITGLVLIVAVTIDIRKRSKVK